jgi:hypothetical protein
MLRPLVFALAVAALGVALTAGPTLASEKPVEIAGAWRFRTATFPNGCVIDGVMNVRRISGDRYACTLTTKQTCEGFSGGAEETCTAQRSGANLTIKSTVTSFDWAGGSYAPDDFKLTIVSTTYMQGEFSSTHTSATDRASVEFYRGQIPNS